MSKTTRKRYSAEFKAKVAVEAIRGELTISQLGARHGVHQTMINAWKKQAMENLSTVFEGRPERPGDSIKVGALDDFTFDDVFGQEADRPASAASRRFGAGQCDELSLALAIEDGLNRRRLALLAGGHRAGPFGHQLFANASHHSNVGVERAADLCIRPTLIEQSCAISQPTRPTSTPSRMPMP